MKPNTFVLLMTESLVLLTLVQPATKANSAPESGLNRSCGPVTPPGVLNGYYKCIATNPTTARCHLVCNTGYTQSSSETERKTIRCRNNKWNYAKLTSQCKRINCGKVTPPPDSYGYHKCLTSKKTSAKCQLYCKGGYMPVGMDKETLQCKNNKWNYGKLKSYCKKLGECGKPTPPSSPESHYRCEYQENGDAKCVFHCRKPYKDEGQKQKEKETIKCRNNKWTYDDLKQKKCTAPISKCAPPRPSTTLGEYHCIYKDAKTAECSLQCDPTFERVGPRAEKIDCKDKSWTYDTLRSFCKVKHNKGTVKLVQQMLQRDNIHDLGLFAKTLLNTTYFYLGLSAFYNRADVALPGFANYMSDQWSDYTGHVRDIIEYTNRRGGYITLYDLPHPISYELMMTKFKEDDHLGLDGMQLALTATRHINDETLQLVKKLEDDRKDPHLKHFLEDGLLSTLVEKLKGLADAIHQLEDFTQDDYALGEYVMDTKLKGH